jgi:hypothetical protein
MSVSICLIACSELQPVVLYLHRQPVNQHVSMAFVSPCHTVYYRSLRISYLTSCKLQTEHNNLAELMPEKLAFLKTRLAYWNNLSYQTPHTPANCSSQGEWVPSAVIDPDPYKCTITDLYLSLSALGTQPPGLVDVVKGGYWKPYTTEHAPDSLGSWHCHDNRTRTNVAVPNTN